MAGQKRLNPSASMPNTAEAKMTKSMSKPFGAKPKAPSGKIEEPRVIRQSAIEKATGLKQ